MEEAILQTDDSRSRVKIDPRTKLFLLISVNLLMLSDQTQVSIYYIKGFLALMLIILLLTEGKMKMALWFLVLYGMAQYGKLVLLDSATGGVAILLHFFVDLVLRFMPGTILGYYLITSTKVSAFIAAMERMHMPAKVIIPLSVMFRFLPTIVEEHRFITDSMRMRGIGANFMKKPAMTLEYHLVPLMMSIIKIGNDISAAALTRGLGKPVKRTSRCEINFGGWDFLLFFIIGLASLAFVLLRQWH